MPQRLSVGQVKFLQKHRYIFRKLAEVSNSERKKVLEKAPPQLFKALEIVLGLLATDQIPLSKTQKQVIKKHKRAIKSVSELKRTAIKRRLQSGGSLAKLLSSVLPVIAGIISKVI